MPRDFGAFKNRIEREFLGHPVVVRNEYCLWFRQGDFSVDHLRYFVQQFSVFSNLFLIAALQRVINADTLESARESKEILMNELGVIYRKRSADQNRLAEEARVATESATDPDLVSTEGTVDGGTSASPRPTSSGPQDRSCRPRPPTWAKRRHGTPSLSSAMSWNASTASGLQRGAGRRLRGRELGRCRLLEDLISGLEKVGARSAGPAARLFTFHDKIEGQHREHVWTNSGSLRTTTASTRRLPARRVEMLDGVKAFWDGLYAGAAGGIGAAWRAGDRTVHRS
jgi:hypothetical protein